jgi:light-regulated signal transduction histidine kinase (bacteriophytochrome)
VRPAGAARDEESRNDLRLIGDGAQRMRVMLEAILESSRLGPPPGEVEPCDSGAVLTQVLEQLGPLLQSAGAVVTHDRPLPSVRMEASQLARVLQNLLQNAVKFNASPPPRVHVGARRERDAWVLSVADNGIGIDPRHHARVFEMFRRLHTRQEYAGDGVGLAICRRVVERFGGRIWVESPPQGGSVFHLNIPDGEQGQPA